MSASSPMHRVSMLLLALAVAFLSLAITARPAAAANPFPEDTVELREELRHSDVRIDWKREMPPTAKANYNRPAKLGDVRLWVALDGVSGTPYLKEFQLRGTSKTAELWTAVDLAYPDGDCRNDPARINVTDAQ